MVAMTYRVAHLAALSAALFFGMTSIATAQATTAPAIDLPDLAPILADLETLRGLSFSHAVPAEVQSLADFDDYLRHSIDQMYPLDHRDGMMAGLHTLRMIDVSVDLGDAFRHAAMTQAAAYYDPESDTFYYLMTDGLGSSMAMVAAHELTHALQDQHFDLTKFLEELMAIGADEVRNDDAILAARALVEGEATYVHTMWQFKQGGVDPVENIASVRDSIRAQANADLGQIIALSKMAFQAGGGGDNDMVRAINAMEDIPEYILKPLYAAYMLGAKFVSDLHETGGWNAVNNAYAARPASMEQVLHPKKYITDIDRPTPLTLPTFETLDDFTRIDAAIHGEFYLGMWLQAMGASNLDARRAAAGWDGDIYSAYRNDAGDVIVVLATTWDDDDQAKQFRTTLARCLTNDMALRKAAAEPVGRLSVAGTMSATLAWTGREVFLVIGNDATLRTALTEELLAMTVNHVE
ncbi:MAG: hypothetical protein KC983_01820 [Phycisphaerales bacterium]|nr:hypothetical protein [Phycisphaerales bacterium]